MTSAAKPLLIDIGPLSCGCTDHALENIYKALSEPVSGDDIWAPHHDPYVRDHIEAVTARGLSILGAVLDDLLLFISGGHLAKAGYPDRWTPEQLAAVRSQLETKGSDHFDLADWLLLVDWLIQRHLPPETIITEAEYLAVRSVFAGRIQAAMDGQSLSDAQKAGLVAMAPDSLTGVATFGKPEGLEAAVLKFANARAAEYITDIGERARHRIKSIIISHEEGAAIGSPDATVSKLQQQLFDEFSILNRDWRRVAITEAARNANEGFVASMPTGGKVKRIEAYPTACHFCKKIHGMVFNVVSPSKENKDDWTEVWPGKDNHGRSASPRKRVSNKLIERTDAEMWRPAAGVQHPHCRGTWVRVGEVSANVDPDFKQMLDEELRNI